MATDSTTFCATCCKAENVKKCARCKQISYCSRACQKADWSSHREVCSFAIPTNTNSDTDVDALTLLRCMPSPSTKAANTSTKAAAAVMEVFNTAELRLSIFSLLPAQELLVAQRVCRSWYLHVALEADLKKRLFFQPGPGKLVLAADDGNEENWAIKPRDDKQGRFAGDVLRLSGDPMYLTKGSDDETVVKTDGELNADGKKIVLNPFFTKLWPQLSENMTLVPYTARNEKACYLNKGASWRRMQLTSPPISQLSMSVWITRPSDGRGNQLRPETGHVETGVTMGHLSDLLDTIPKKFQRHWMMIDGSAWWLQSADAELVLEKREARDISQSGRTYVNPSNGIAFPGGF